jgi:signal transduction histidine kinase
MLVAAQTAWSQRTGNWRVYKAADGISEAACISVTLTPRGKILARHLNTAAASELDGYDVRLLPLPEAGNSRVYESPGRQLWTTGPEGLQEFRGSDWVTHQVPEITAQFRAERLRPLNPVPLCPIRQDLVLFLLPDRLVQFNAEDSDHPRTETVLTAEELKMGPFFSMTPARDGGLWISAAQGLVKAPGPLRTLKTNGECQKSLLPEELEIRDRQEPHEDEEGSITVVAAQRSGSEKVLAHFDGRDWTVLGVGNEKLRQAWRGPDKTYWASTIATLFHWPAGQTTPVENDDTSARQYFDVAIEPSGVFWLATADGLFRYAPLTWRMPRPTQGINSLVHCLAADSEGRLWFVAGGGLHSLQNEQLVDYALPAELRGLQARALFTLKDGSLLLDAEDAIFQFQPTNGLFRSLSTQDSGRRLRPLGVLKDGGLCVESYPVAATESASTSKWLVYDGVKFEAFQETPPEEFTGNSFSAFFSAQNGDLWLGGLKATACYHDNKWKSVASIDKTAPQGAVGFAELADGKIWCATQDRIWEFDGRNWSEVRSAFDRINSLVRARDGSIWVASNSGVHRFFHGAWIQNGIEEGLPSAGVRELLEDQLGHVWAGTTHGLGRYHPEADPDPPQTEIETVPGTHLREGTPLIISFSGRDKWKYTPRDRLLYSYRLDDQDWSPFQELTSVPLSELLPGKHYFQVRALDRNGNLTGQGPKDPRPAQIEFAIVLPWYREARLVAISFAGLAVAVFFAGLAFNRHRQLVRSYAAVEQTIQERTKELEIANRELLHSQKMNALGTIAAGIAHDFNNILSIIKGSAQIIEENLDNPEKISRRVDRINMVVAQGAGIVKAMLGFSREPEVRPGTCDLNAVVDDTIKLLGDRFLHEVEVRFEPAPGPLEVVAFKDFTTQILLNFIFNAAESMTGRKQIILATQPLAALPTGLVLMPAAAKGYASVSVQDFGCGIPPENRPRIFEPFFTTKALSVRRGTGLGLSMVYELAKKMGAGLAVASVVDQGSVFTLFLPTGQPSAETNLQK